MTVVLVRRDNGSTPLIANLLDLRASDTCLSTP
jgi:hypothetical protein